MLPPQQNEERLRAKATKKLVEQIEPEDGNRIPNINYILDIGEGKVEEFVTYNQLLDHLVQAEDNRKISMIFPLVSCCSCVNNPSSS